jgi:uncharacterized protein (DUF1810 family)
MSSLDRFKRAQAQPYAGFDTALEEMRAGRKRSHWIWYVFPQLSGLGSSEMSRRFGLEGLAEAIEYLEDSMLRGRFLIIAQAVADRVRQDGVPLRTLMGSAIDATKLVSSLTLFEHAARTLDKAAPDAEMRSIADICGCLLDDAASAGYARCQRTLAQIAAGDK